MFRKLSKNAFIRGSFIYTLISFGINILNYIFNLILARFFPLSVYGEYMTAMSYVVLFSVPFGAMAVLLIKKIGERRVEDRIAYLVSLEKWFISNLESRFIPMMAIFAFLGLILIYKANLAVNSVVFIIAMTIVLLATLPYSSALQAFKRFPSFGLANALGTIFKICAGILVVVTIKNLSAVYAMIIFSMILIYFLIKKAVFRGQKNLQIKIVEIRSEKILQILRKKSIALPILATLGMAGILSADLMLVKKLFDADSVGLYAGLSLLGKIILYGTMPVTAVAYTFFTGNESNGSSRRVLMASTVVLLGVGSLAMLFYGLYPSSIVRFVFGENFVSIANLVPLVALFGVLYSLNYLLCQFLVSRNSWLSLGSLVALIFQISGILLFHQNFYQVLMVGIISLSGLMVVYLGGIFFEMRKKS